MKELNFRFEAIKRHYAEFSPIILTEPSDEWAIDAYAWDTPSSGIRLSPIEQALWCDIRQQNMVMYPQYPVGGYFVDFANPVAKVAIECDGAAFHVDAAKDAARQRHIEAKGWTVYRIAGYDCVKNEEVFDDENGHERVASSPAWQFIKFIGRNHNVARGARPTAGPVSMAEVMARVLVRIAGRAETQRKQA